MNKRYAFAGMVVLAVLLAGCSNAAQGLTFKPPADWKSFGIGPVQMWFPPGQSGDGKRGTLLMLLRVPADRHVDPMSEAQIKDAKIVQNKTIQICGNHPAQYKEFTSRRSERSGVGQMVQATWGKTTYFAMYVRDTDAAENAQASAAIKELCPVASSS